MTEPQLPDEVAAAVERGESVIPVGTNKKPLVDGWKCWQTERPTLDQVSRWHREKRPPAWASITGEIGGHVVIDGDGEPGREQLRRFGLEPHFATGHGGRHARVAYPGRHVPTLNGKSKRELGKRFPGIEVKGDGGYAFSTDATAAAHTNSCATSHSPNRGRSSHKSSSTCSIRSHGRQPVRGLARANRRQAASRLRS